MGPNAHEALWTHGACVAHWAHEAQEALEPTLLWFELFYRVKVPMGAQCP